MKKEEPQDQELVVQVCVGEEPGGHREGSVHAVPVHLKLHVPLGSDGQRRGALSREAPLITEVAGGRSVEVR